MNRSWKYILVFLVAVSGRAYVHAQVVLQSFSFSNGSGTLAGTQFRLSGDIGQTFSGNAASASYKLQVAGNAAAIDRSPDLQITEATVSTDEVVPGGEVSVTFTVKNSGDTQVDADIKVAVFLSKNADLDAADVKLITFTIGNSLSVSGLIDYPTGVQSNKVPIPVGTAVDSYRLILKADPDNTISERNENNNLNISQPPLLLDVKTSVGSADDNLPPVFGSITSPASAVAGLAISAVVTDNLSGVKEVRFFHRKIISKGEFELETVTSPGDNYSVTIEADWFDEVGFEGYFNAVDDKDNESENTAPVYVYVPTPADQAIPDLSFGGQAGNYRIFSIPYELADNRIDEIFKNMGEYDKTLWRIVRYQGGRNVDKKDGLTKIERGQAFWFNAINKPDVKIGTGTTVSKTQSPDFTMTLEQGYNQIGGPFTFDVSWTDVLNANATKKTKLSQQVLVYNPTKVSLDPSDALEAWGGGFVLADEAMTLSIPVTLKDGPGRRSSTAITNLDPDMDEWMIPISLQQDGVMNSLSGIGMHPDAKVSKDIYDIVTPPQFIKYVGMNTVHDDFFKPKFSRDVVPTTKTYNWNFNIESNINTSSAEISWDNHELAGATSELLLYDVSERTLIDMKASGHYSFDPKRSHNFKFFFGADPSFVKPDIQEIGNVWPNAVTDIAHVPYLVKEKSVIQIDIYDLVGRRITRVVDGEQEAGYHTAMWDRTASDGAVVSPGIYLYRMNGSNHVGRIIVN